MIIGALLVIFMIGVCNIPESDDNPPRERETHGNLYKFDK